MPRRSTTHSKTGKPNFGRNSRDLVPDLHGPKKPILSSLTRRPKFSNLAYFVIDFDSQKELLSGSSVLAVQSTLIAFKGGKEQGRTVGDTDVNPSPDSLNKAL